VKCTNSRRRGGRSSGLLRTVLKRDLRERPVKTEPFGRWREAQEDIAGRTLWAPPPSRPAADRQSPPSGGSSEKSGDLLKQAILLGFADGLERGPTHVGNESPAGVIDLASEKAGVTREANAGACGQRPTIRIYMPHLLQAGASPIAFICAHEHMRA
jgi:hypothetical protein